MVPFVDAAETLLIILEDLVLRVPHGADKERILPGSSGNGFPKEGKPW
jgi:hypothetical protein